MRTAFRMAGAVHSELCHRCDVTTAQPFIFFFFLVYYSCNTKSFQCHMPCVQGSAQHSMALRVQIQKCQPLQKIRNSPFRLILGGHSHPSPRVQSFPIPVITWQTQGQYKATEHRETEDRRANCWVVMQMK